MNKSYTSFDPEQENGRDEFKRLDTAAKILKMASSTDTNVFPLMLDGNWGSGKSEFCHKLVTLSEQDFVEAKAIYIDAYLYDYTEDPLMMILTQLSKSLDINDPNKKSLKDKSLGVLKVLGKTGIKAGTSWLLKSSSDDIGKDLSEAISESAPDLIDDTMKLAFDNFEKVEQNIEKLKVVLKEISNKEPLVIVIDELDRCKPTFALSLLEKIKHIFEVPNIKFVLSVNSQQLYSIIKKQYGMSIDAELYLRKFFKQTISLSETLNNFSRYRVNNAHVYLEAELSSSSKYSKLVSSRSWEKAILENLFQSPQRTLRDVDDFINALKVLSALDSPQRIEREARWFSRCLRLIGVYISVFNKQLSSKILSKKCTQDDFESFFNFKFKEIPKNECHQGINLFYSFMVSCCAGVELETMLGPETFKNFTAEAQGAYHFDDTSNEVRLNDIGVVIGELQFMYND